MGMCKVLVIRSRMCWPADFPVVYKTLHRCVPGWAPPVTVMHEAPCSKPPLWCECGQPRDPGPPATCAARSLLVATWYYHADEVRVPTWRACVCRHGPPKAWARPSQRPGSTQRIPEGNNRPYTRLWLMPPLRSHYSNQNAADEKARRMVRAPVPICVVLCRERPGMARPAAPKMPKKGKTWPPWAGVQGLLRGPCSTPAKRHGRDGCGCCASLVGREVRVPLAHKGSR